MRLSRRWESRFLLSFVDAFQLEGQRSHRVPIPQAIPQRKRASLKLYESGFMPSHWLTVAVVKRLFFLSNKTMGPINSLEEKVKKLVNLKLTV